MMPYKVQLVQELKPIDHPMHFRFAKWACDRLTEDADFGKKNHFPNEKVLAEPEYTTLCNTLTYKGGMM